MNDDVKVGDVVRCTYPGPFYDHVGKVQKVCVKSSEDLKDGDDQIVTPFFGHQVKMPSCSVLVPLWGVEKISE